MQIRQSTLIVPIAQTARWPVARLLASLVELLAGEIEERGREKREHKNAEKAAGRKRSHQFGAEGEKIGAPGQTKCGCEPVRDAIGDLRVLQKINDDAKQPEDASGGDQAAGKE